LGHILQTSLGRINSYVRLDMRKALILFIMVSLFGCNQMEIKVTDENNLPLVGAEITSLAPSMESATNLTDKNGIAVVPKIIGGNMLRVKLAGFETAFINTASKIPESVVLKKSSASLIPHSSGTPNGAL
jgi:hypothetical protein